MIEAQHRLLTEGLKVDHLRLVIGTSMGGMHTWLWGKSIPTSPMRCCRWPVCRLRYPAATASGGERSSTPSATIRNGKDGEYVSQPQSLRTALELLYFMSSNPVLRFKESPSRAAADQVLDKYVADKWKEHDANDVLYALEASHDYDPAPGLDKIEAPLLAINFADDLINPPELGVLEREIKRVPHGTALVIPCGENSAGHGTHTVATVWKDHLVTFLEQSEPVTK